MSLTAYPSNQDALGYFRIFAQPPGGVRREITIFRNAPVIMQSSSTVDPFTEATASLSLPQVTLFDNPGKGDLDWLVPDCDIDIVWQNTGSYDLVWSWEGYIASFQFGISGADATYQVDLKGALFGLDDYLAIPSFPKRPIPYEILIAEAFDQTRHPSRLGSFRVLFPGWWTTTVPEYADQSYLTYLKPWGVTTGQLWTGFTSRSTGSWEPLLTGNIQGLLSVMFAEGGSQWSVRNRGSRRPELYLREIPDSSDQDIIEIVLGGPGVTFTGSRDYTQRASVIYGQGVDDAGISFSGLSISPDGTTSTYTPFAYSPVVYPRQHNANYNSNVKPKETLIRFQDGVDEVSAAKIAQGQYQRFSEPGITGSITLQADVRYSDGTLCPRLLIKAGQTVRLRGLLGISEGILVHITQSQVDYTSLTVSLEFDSKYRDALTVEEVKARTRDALTPLRALQVGKYSNTVQDLVLPWSYAEGSGCVPQAAKEFFQEKIPSTATWPYEEWTQKYPPSNPSSRNYYVRLNPTDVSNSTNNWTGVARDGDPILAIPVRMSQAGSIRLSQIAAYDKNGNVLPVRFHASVYSTSGIGPMDMPQFDHDPDVAPVIKFLKPEGITVNYGTTQSNPFFETAWEQVNPDGTKNQNASDLPAGNAGLIIGWGNYYEPAGYSPGRFSRGAARTGMLEDTTAWSWDLSSQLDLLSPETNVNREYAGMLFVMIYCDEQGPTDPVYFLGRFFRQEPGT